MFGIWASAVSSFCFTIVESALASTLLYQARDDRYTATFTPFVALAAGFSVVAAFTTPYLCVVSTRQRSHLFVQHKPRRQYWTCFGLLLTASLLEGCGMVWLTVRQPLVQTPLHSVTEHVLKSWSVMWVLAVIARVALLALFGSWIKETLSSDGIRQRALQVVRERSPVSQLVRGPRRSTGSRATDFTHPQTASPAASSSLLTTTTKVGSSVWSKTTRCSPRSSLETERQRDVKASSPVNAFDNWDTTCVDPGTRETILSAPSPAIRSGLETMPGSRSGSDWDVAEKPYLPSSPRLGRSQPSNRVIGIDGATTTAGPVTTDGQYSSPPRSFSRPASNSYNRDSILCELPSSPFSLVGRSIISTRPSASMNDLIHPLFRPDSPQPPPPILSSRTMVTASPLADRPISPMVVAQLRSDSDLQQQLVAARPCNIRKVSTRSTSSEGRRRRPLFEPSEQATVRARSRSNPPMSMSIIIPSPARAARTVKSSPYSVPATPALTSPRPRFSPQPPSSASPRGPTHRVSSPELHSHNQDENNILLPDFILHAGARSSLLDYGRRKSVKDVRDASAEFDMV